MISKRSIALVEAQVLACEGGRDARPPEGGRVCSARTIARHSRLTARFALSLAPVFAAAAPVVWAEDFRVPAGHPRLLLTGDDVAAIRVRCGTQGPGDAPGAKDRFGTQREVLERLRDVAREIMAGQPRADDLFVPAMMHLATGQPGRADEYTRYVADALLDPHRRLYELDALVALDWCWDAIETDVRVSICDRLPPVPEVFSEEVSPLDHLAFYRRLCALAEAIVRYRSPGLSPAQDERFDRVILAGRHYLEGPFVEFCRQRGAVPTSGEHGIWEEADYALALELLRAGLDRNLWSEVAGSFGRAMEHYLYADTEHPALEHGFIHDDGSEIPARPGELFRGFVPAVPWAIARHTRDPAAVRYAKGSLTRQGKIVSAVDRYGWVRLMYGPMDDAEVNRRACPLGRNFGGGWVAMRTGWAPGETVVLFDAGQPFWRSRQHFDAGQFQIYRKGRLAVPSGDDVTFEATAAKQGRTVIGGQLGDWDRYFQATIAHNCVTVTDRGRAQSLYGRPWPALGNQRLIGHDYEPSEGDLDKSGRKTGRLLAFETNDFYSYAAADLAPAYPPEVVLAIRREVLLLNAGAVLVLDRVAAPSNKSLKNWHLQLPSFPELVRVRGTEGPVGTRPATSAPSTPALKQVFGTDPSAGIWEVADDHWLSVTQQDGRLWVRTLLPAKAKQLVIGGPMRPRKIAGGPLAGQTYFGGDVQGFEYRLWPAALRDGPTAAYELGRPTGLGPQFGVGANWGRLDVAPADNAEEVVFLHLLIPTDKTVSEPPAIRFETTRNSAVLEFTLGTQQIRVTLAVIGPRGGGATVRDLAGTALLEQKLAADVQPDRAIPRIPAP